MQKSLQKIFQMKVSKSQQLNEYKEYQSQINSQLQQSQIQQKVNNIQQGYTKVRAYLLTTPETELPVQNPLTNQVGVVPQNPRSVSKINPIENIQEPQILKTDKPVKNIQMIYKDYIEEYEQKQQKQIMKAEEEQRLKQEKQQQKQKQIDQREKARQDKLLIQQQEKLEKTQKAEQEKLEKQRLQEQQRLERQNLREQQQLQKQQQKQEKEEERQRKQLQKQQEKENKQMLLSQQKPNSTLYVSNLTQKKDQDYEESTDSLQTEKIHQKKKMVVEISDFSNYIRYKIHQKQTEGCQRCCRIFQWMLLIFIAIVTSITLYLVSMNMFIEQPIINVTSEKVQLSQQSLNQINNQLQVESKNIISKIDELKKQISNIKVQCNYSQPQQKVVEQKLVSPSECKDMLGQIKVLEEKIDNLQKKETNPYTELIKQHTILRPRVNITSITTSSKSSRWWPQLFNLRDQMIPGECFAMKRKNDMNIVTSPFYLRYLIVGHPTEEELQEVGRAHAPADIKFKVKYISGVNQYQTIEFTKHFDLNGPRFQKIDFEELQDKEAVEIDIQLNNENDSKTVCLYEFTMIGDYTQLVKKQDQQK